MYIINPIGQIIKQLRSERHLSQFQLSKLSNISRSTISLIESGKRQPTHEQTANTRKRNKQTKK